MKKKNLFILLLTSFLCISFLVPSARAGSKQKHRWEGVAIGIGAAILGGALIKQHHKYNSHHKVAHYPAPVHKYRPKRHHRPSGHWDVRKEWIPPTHRTVWNPGHYDRHGRWVPGQWIEIVDRSGYWTKTRVWVRRR